ncbi:CbtA family protein [Roseiconus nitratireducens]|uniref:CbtA family protein n=1 Tax=Roseiconus nitratireducens TaxID=2605748 RepID=A0A5M6DEV4_9BACT|nr:CbtA family protein [Roseiconus nitratireducens]KAA5546067.1 CbtA family protein [Roseiconus nitratireducens]
MSCRSLSLCAGFLAALGFATLTGCSQPTEPADTSAEAAHDHDSEAGDHDHAEGEHDHADDEHEHEFATLDEATEEIESLNKTIKDGFANNDVDAAHDPLHHIGEVLEATDHWVQESDLPEPRKQELAAAIEQLFDAFGAIDESLHGDGGKSYDEVSESIQSALDTLNQDTQ